MGGYYLNKDTPLQKLQLHLAASEILRSYHNANKQLIKLSTLRPVRGNASQRSLRTDKWGVIV